VTWGWHHCRFLWTDIDVEPAVMWFSGNMPKNTMKNRRKKNLISAEVPPDSHTVTRRKSHDFSHEKRALDGRRCSNPWPPAPRVHPLTNPPAHLFVSSWDSRASHFMFI
jgi:hypothetical protein